MRTDSSTWRGLQSYLLSFLKALSAKRFPLRGINTVLRLSPNCAMNFLICCHAVCHTLRSDRLICSNWCGRRKMFHIPGWVVICMKPLRVHLSHTLLINIRIPHTFLKATPKDLEDHGKQLWWLTEEFFSWWGKKLLHNSWPDQEHSPGGNHTVSKSIIKRRLHQSKYRSCKDVNHWWASKRGRPD